MEITVKENKGADGTAKRFTIGKPGGDVSGAIYVKAGVDIPDNVLLIFKKGEQNEKV